MKLPIVNGNLAIVQPSIDTIKSIENSSITTSENGMDYGTKQSDIHRIDRSNRYYQISKW